MAATVKRLCLTAQRCTQVSSARLRVQTPIRTQRRPFTSKPFYRDESSDSSTPPSTNFISSLEPSERATYDTLSPEDREQFQIEYEAIDDGMSQPDVDRRINDVMFNAVREVQANTPREMKPDIDYKPGFMSLGEDDEVGTGSDDEFGEDDISSLAHGELEQHREIREYARIAAWEMPLLSKLAKPFEPPPSSHLLRFRSTTYLGETHPASKKIVLEFCTADLPNLTSIQREKLIKLAGPRYNPATDIVKMSCEMFESPAQNKRYLGDLVDTLMREAQDGADTFADVPFDFRHVKRKPRPRFPREWNMTEERRQRLDGIRQERRLLAEKQEVVDGAKMIEMAMAERMLARPLPGAGQIAPADKKEGRRLRRE
ncbi:MAG: 37S ribosomal protein S24, mitochondrial [Sclerophora amabilis]|nr:MAG: 37S ribosomal protein S24, mitochondrial [Sclerophora amabilis]